VLPYGAILYFLALVLGILAAIEAEDRRRYAFIAAVAVLYVVPPAFPRFLPGWLLLAGRVVLGLAAYIHLRLAGYRIR
jgi:hypothetical protein